MRKNKLWKGKKAQASIFIVFIIVALTVVTLAGVMAPLGVRFTTEMLAAGDQILLDSNATIQGISNATIRDSITASIGEAHTAADDNVTILTWVFQYAWVVVLALVGIVVFLFTRRMVEFSSYGGGFI